MGKRSLPVRDTWSKPLSVGFDDACGPWLHGLEPLSGKAIAAALPAAEGE